MSGDRAYLIRPLIDTPLKDAEKQYAKQIVDLGCEIEMEPERLALAVLQHLLAMRAKGSRPPRSADESKDRWLFAMAQLTRTSPACAVDEPLSQPKVAERALKAMSDICMNGATSEPGFEGMKRAWFAHPAAAAACQKPEERCKHLPRIGTITEALKTHIQGLRRAEDAFN